MTTQIEWKGSFKILLQETPSFDRLRGDKIILPQSALEEILSTASALSHTLQSDSQSQSNLPSPLTFRLTNTENRKEVYAGILEFSAPDGSVAISPLLAGALGLDEDLPSDDDSHSSARLIVQICHLSKGSYVRLRPLEAGYDADDWKALLERQLRSGFTTLTCGLTLSVSGLRNENFRFLVDKLSPDESAVCIVDTDLEVDIEALDEEQARETLRQLVTRDESSSAKKLSSGGELDIWKPLGGQVFPGAYVDFTLPSWSRSQPLTITLAPNDEADGDAIDLFVSPKSARQRVPPRELEHVFGSFTSEPDGSKTLRLEPSNVELEGAETLAISVHGYLDPDKSHSDKSRAIQFTVRAQAAIASETNGASPITSHSAEDEQCQNCKQWVPKRTMVLHQNFCLRNNVRCSKCDALFKKGSPEFASHWHCDLDDAAGNSEASKRKHDSVYHSTRQCPSCEFSTNSIPDLARHRTTVCPAKLILCRFCHLEVPQEGDPFSPSAEVVLSGLTAHELADGARTTDCHLCQKIIRLRDLETHMKHHELDKTKRDLPPLCRNINCGRTLHGVGPRGQVRSSGPQSEDTRTKLGLCVSCFGPLYVSMHDPEGKALRRRIERRYLGQMMTGCGKGHCGNEWCRTGRSNKALEAKASSAQGVLPLIKPLLADASQAGLPLYFCVDEGSQKQRQMAEIAATEGVWDEHWTVAAAEAEGGDLSRMRDWLQAWAPTKYS